MSAASRVPKPLLRRNMGRALDGGGAFAGGRNLGQTFPNPAVGALMVRQETNRVIISRGVTARGGRPHAEAEALRTAGALQKARRST